MENITEDNIFDNNTNDIIICDCNVSKIFEEQNKKSEIKKQRNDAEKDKQKYKTAFEIVSVLLIIALFIIVFIALEKQSNKNINDCLNAGHSEYVCYKMEGIY